MSDEGKVLKMPAPAEVVPDAECLKVLEHLTERVKAGEVIGLVVMTVMAGHGVGTCWTSVPKEAPIATLGGLRILALRFEREVPA